MKRIVEIFAVAGIEKKRGQTPFLAAMKKPFTTITVGIFVLVALVHVLRLVWGWEVTIQGSIVPMWVSVVGVVIAGYLAFMVWRESRN